MKKIGLFYGINAPRTTIIAEKIKEAFGDVPVDLLPVETAEWDDFGKYDNLVVGVATWFDGELPFYWDEVKPELESLELKGKKVALFGLGDQVKYPENFIDGVGILADTFESAGARVIGLTPVKGYDFEKSRALRGGKFAGLAIDLENQPMLTDERIKSWVEQLKKEFD